MIANLDADYIRRRPSKAAARLITHVLFQGRPVTARWRWINALVSAQFALFKRLPQLKEVDKPIFILGTGRSGTTILGHVLSLHPQVGFLNEPKALWHAVHPEEDLIGTYCRGPARYRLGVDDVSPQVRHAAHRLYGYYLAVTRAERVLDKYPEMIFRVPFVLELFPAAKFILLVRNGWDTVRSIARWSRQNRVSGALEIYDWWGANNRKWRLLVEQIVAASPAFSGMREEVASLSRQADMAAVEWIATMREGLHWQKELPQLVHLVHYEDLTGHPRAALGEIADFCGLAPDRTFSAYGCGILESRPSQGRLDLAPALQPLFDETMMSLGYAA